MIDFSTLKIAPLGAFLVAYVTVMRAPFSHKCTFLNQNYDMLRLT